MEEQDEMEMVMVYDADGVPKAFAVFLMVELEGQEFAALISEDQLDDDETDLWFFRHHPGVEGKGRFTWIHDDDLLERVDAEVERRVLGEDA